MSHWHCLWPWKLYSGFFFLLSFPFLSEENWRHFLTEISYLKKDSRGTAKSHPEQFNIFYLSSFPFRIKKDTNRSSVNEQRIPVMTCHPKLLSPIIPDRRIKPKEWLMNPLNNFKMEILIFFCIRMSAFFSSGHYAIIYIGTELTTWKNCLPTPISISLNLVLVVRSHNVFVCFFLSLFDSFSFICIYSAGCGCQSIPSVGFMKKNKRTSAVNYLNARIRLNPVLFN